MQADTERRGREFESFLDELIFCSKRLVDAVNNENIDEIGQLLDIRQKCLAELTERRMPKTEHTLPVKAAIDEASALDRAIVQGLNEFARKSGLDVTRYQKKAKGLLMYSSGDYDLTQGKLLDRKR